MNLVGDHAARFRGLPLRTMAIWLALIVTIFLTRDRWEAWVVERVLPERSGHFRQVTISPNKTRAVISCSNTLYLWDIDRASALACFTSSESGAPVAFSPDGGHVVILVALDGLRDRTPFQALPTIVNAATGEIERELPGYSAGISYACYLPHGDRVIAAGTDGSTPVWSAASGELLFVLREKRKVHMRMFSPDGSLIATTSPWPDDSVCVWNARNGDPAAECRGGHYIGFTASSKRILTRLYRAHSTTLWDIESGSALRTWEGVVVKLSADCSVIRTEDPDGSSALWDAETGEPARQGVRFVGHESRSRRTYAPDRSLYVTFTEDCRLYVWDAESEKPVSTIAPTCRSLGQSFGFGGPSGEFLEDSRRFVSCDAPRWGDAVTEVWHLPSGRKVASFPSLWLTRPFGAKRIIGQMRDGKPTILCRIRPEWWWGVFWLWQFWVIAGLTVALVVSIWRDQRELRRSAGNLS
ncbi:MAG: WD40 repeat domain-containing protein [Planctomycetota bacterium]